MFVRKVKDIAMVKVFIALKYGILYLTYIAIEKLKLHFTNVA